MNRHLATGIFALGLACIAWVGWSLIDSSALALLMTMLIGLVYLLGAGELRQFHTATHALDRALQDTQQPVESIDAWLTALPSTLQEAVRLRVEGGRAALPGPTLTPYLVGLLVMLGMLGTFLGMVVTFKGAVFAVEGAADFQTVRAALAAPIKGLGLAFGTSVAGVAGSAMLGLLSALCRHERIKVSRLLDHRIATTLRNHSQPFQREQTLKALQTQMHALPQAVQHLETLVHHLDQQSQRLAADMSQRQDQFHQRAALAYTELASSVGQSLRDVLAGTARATAEQVQPIVHAAMAGMAEEMANRHEALNTAMASRVDQLGAGFHASAKTMLDACTQALQSQSRSNTEMAQSTEHALTAFSGRFEDQSKSLVLELSQSLRQLHAERAAADAASQAGWLKTLENSADRLRDEWRGATEQTAAQHQAISMTLQQASEIVAEQAKAHVQRDIRSIGEHEALRERMDALMANLEQSATLQRNAMLALASAADTLMGETNAQLTKTLESQTQAASVIATHVNASAIELSSLGEAFQHAMALFVESNSQLAASLRSVEAAVQQSMSRSDEQLAYYVGQAREVIDLSLSAQHAVVDDLRRLRGQPTALNEAGP